MNQNVKDMIEQARVQDRGYFIYQWGGSDGHQSVEKAIDLRLLVELISRRCAEIAGGAAGQQILTEFVGE